MVVSRVNSRGRRTSVKGRLEEWAGKWPARAQDYACQAWEGWSELQSSGSHRLRRARWESKLRLGGPLSTRLESLPFIQRSMVFIPLSRREMAVN